MPNWPPVFDQNHSEIELECRRLFFFSKPGLRLPCVPPASPGAASFVAWLASAGLASVFSRLPDRQAGSGHGAFRV
jgi:hypothetical protein